MSRRIVVVGGGIAGLAAAHRVVELNNEHRLGLEVTLLEATHRLGGSITTERVGDYLVEAGPDSFITEKPWALSLCERLGLTSHLVSTQAAHQKIYVVRNGRLQLLPEGFLLLAPTRMWPFIRTPLFSWRGKLRILCDLVLPRGRIDEDESLGSFVRRRFGSEALERVAQPLVGGIYAADPDRLSLNATMPRFKEMERLNRSVAWAMWAAQRRRSRGARPGSGARWSLFVTLAGGMQELVEALGHRLPEGSIRLNAPVSAVMRDENNTAWRISAGVDELEAAAVIIAAPAFGAAAMLRNAAHDVATELGKISYASTSTVSLAYRAEDFPRPLDSFGFVVPAVERRKVMACTFSSVKYPGRAPAGGVLLRAFVGGTLQAELYEDGDATMEENVRHELSSLLGVTATPLFCRIWRHPRSMPQYQVGHEALIERVGAALGKLPGIALAGSAYRGVGISDCVRTGEEAAAKVVKELTGTVS